MKITTYISHPHELSLALDSGLDEVIISQKYFGRFSETSSDEFNHLAKQASEKGLKVIFEWDILINEVDFDTCVQKLSKLNLVFVDVIRVQDIGVLNYVMENMTQKIQLICENNNHNFLGIKTWCDFIGTRLDRIVLSPQLSKDKLKEITNKLSCPVELLGLGRVLLFYSPRKLLSPYFPTKGTDETLLAVGESEETPHKGFPVIQNRHGSFMFHIKDLFLIDKIAEIQDMGISHLRLDLRFNDFQIVRYFKKNNFDLDINVIKSLYKTDVIRGYFQVNKSDVLFKKLKNYRLQRRDESYIGEVLETIKGELMAINISGDCSVNIGDQLRFVTPEGKEHTCMVHQLKNVQGLAIESANQGQLALINYMSGVWTKSQVYFQN